MAHLQVMTVRHRPPTLLERAKDALRSMTLGPFSLKDPRLRDFFDVGGSTSSGVSVNEATALNYAAVWQAVTLIAGDLGSLPLFYYKRGGDRSKTLYPEHPNYSLLHDAPNPEMSSMVFRETLQAHLLTWGNAYAEIERDAMSRPVALWPLLPSQVQPYRDDRQRLLYRVTGGVKEVVIDPSNMLHVPGLGYDGIVGYSPIRQARESLGLLAASERFGATFFGNGSTFGGVLKHPKIMGEQAQKTLRASIDSQHRGPDKAHRFLILEEGMEYAKLGVNPNDAQFLETRRFQISEVARWFNLPLHKLREMENSSVRANIEQEALDYYVSTLRPWLTRWEQEINRKLISPRERFIQFAEFKLDGVLRGDMKSRYDAYAIGRNWGWLSVNEIRALENMNPIADGDKYLSPMNMIPANRLDEVIDKQVAPAPAPVAPAAPAAEDEGEDEAVMARALARIEAQAQTIGELQTRAEVVSGELAVARAEAERLALELKATAEEREVVRLMREEAEKALSEERADREEIEADHERAVNKLADKLIEADADVKQKAQAMADLASASEALRTQIGQEQHRADVAETALAVAAESLLQAEAREQTAQQAATASETSAADAHARRLVAETHAAAMEADATTARANFATELAIRLQAQAEAGEIRAKQADAFTALSTASRVVVTETLQRLIRRETEKARSKRQTPEKLRTWAEQFYEDHEAAVWVDALQAPVAVHQILVGSERSAREVAHALVAAHFEQSKRQVAAVAASDNGEYHAALDRCLTLWESERAAKVADQFVREEIAYVRSIQ